MRGIRLFNPRTTEEFVDWGRDIVRTLDRIFERAQGRQEDFLIEDNRLILRDSDGHYWSITVDTNGNLQSEDLGTSL